MTAPALVLAAVPDTGFVEVCKNAAGPGVSGTFTFDVGGRTLSVPVGACAQPVEVPVGTITVTEHARPGMVVTDISTFPAGRLVSRDLPDRSVTVTVAAGDISTQTVVTFANAFEVGQLKVCKVAGPGVAGGTGFHFTAGGQAFTVPAGPSPGGFCRLAGDFPAGTSVTVDELAVTGTEVSSISVAPSGRLTGQPDVAARRVTVAIGPGVTEVTFTNRTVQPPVAPTTTVPPTTTTIPAGGPTTTAVPSTAPQATTTTAPPTATTTTVPPTATTTTTAPGAGPTTTLVPGTAPQATTTTAPPTATTTTTPAGPTTTVPGAGPTTTLVPGTAPQATTTTAPPGGPTTTTPAGPTTTVPGGRATTTVPGVGAPTAPTTPPPAAPRAVTPPLALTGDANAVLLRLASLLTLLGFSLLRLSRLRLRPRALLPAEACEPADDFELALADPFFLSSPRAPALALGTRIALRSPLAYARFRHAAASAWCVARGAGRRSDPG